MLDIKFIRDNKDIVEEGAKRKRVEVDIEKLLVLDDERIKQLKEVEDLRSEVNRVSQDIARNQDQALKIQLIEEMRIVKEDIKQKEEKLKATMDEWQKIMLQIPNVTSPDVPKGPDESGNVVIRNWGEKPVFEFTPKEHYEIGEKLGIIDNQTAAEVSGARFTYLKGDLVLMQFALINFILEILGNKEILEKIARDKNINIDTKPFMPVVPPFMVKPNTYLKMARLEPKEDKYHLVADDMYLVGSAEHSLGPMHMNQIIDEKDMPIRYVGYSPAFRREAGSYGKDTKGILRMHQFEKLEMETFCLPENSIQEQEFLVSIQEYLLQMLKLPYQVVLICTGDMGKPDYRQIDIETWMPGQNTYRETHTADLMTSFQSRRLNTKVKRIDGKVELVHMNDATICAIGRTLIAILENYQQIDGTVKIPEVLKKYMGGRETITN
ncbi:MAG: Serine-tRNA ligase [Candidatus Nomurabacteria bacterium GW2011_GWE1_32_28]|uniref:Serine--tRNA ligase n=1 Tax=Candidatus Nomurabacteria bacterium GW2011_GWF1_31_48 TaxID=1618767 RepID=A0A0F9YWA0_9BACT|nr:MAG: Serine-tRNA ligase [Candidatus Nomurabacteria bacterium GW2011_GWF2_30_133]KKP28983.1 MAG: Serine-tRNA ligase [Candidatus Nomurabacteria bacterium GW2011_GWE2_31_40]KKP30721.1 MAG: Serine-tRNA ligase [Candidatus Nomurabacteria bacterium GW2011_GWF1_31_48]KKP35239.1 MAG: Serine-tRNA ligase [Candidatus Nomurabacteria bacterium GW2011_GWE1_32_28]HAS80546.1 serine--tRNA ligase [Candidatus Nomurabacteria bacterium]